VGGELGLQVGVQLEHRGVGVDEALLEVGEHVVDEERAVADPPEGLALVQRLD
jgi:hypothetical protein